MSTLGQQGPKDPLGRLAEMLVESWVLAAGLVLLVVATKLDAQGAHDLARFLEKIGEAVLIVGLIHLLFEAFQRKFYLGLVLQAVRTAIAELWEVYSAFRNLGILMVYPSLPTDLLLEAIAQSQVVRILKTWPPDALLDAALPLAISKRTALDIFVCDPHAHILRQRSLGASAIPTEGLQKTLLLLYRVRQLLHEKPDLRLTVTLFDAWPGVPTIECDNQLFFGLYLRGFCSLIVPWFKVDPESAFGRKLRLQFDSFADEEITASLKTREGIEEWLKEHRAKPPKRGPEKAA